MKRCSICKQRMVKVIYTGFPMWLCKDETCNSLEGFWSFIADYVPFNGMFMTYKGSYLKALWYWLTN